MIDMTCQTRREKRLKSWITLDPLTDRAALAAAMSGHDAVLNLAGVVPGATANADFNLNGELALCVTNAAQKAGVAQVFHCSTAAVYGHAEGPLPETAPLTPISAYGRSKAKMEDDLKRWYDRQDAAPALTCLRIGNIAGADQLLGVDGVATRLVDQFPDGQGPRRSYIGPATLARVIVALTTMACARSTSLPQVLNVAAPGVVAMTDLLDAAGQDWQFRPAPAQAIAEVWLDTGALEKLVPMHANDANPAEIVSQWKAVI